MRVAISPRSINDRGGYYFMPCRTNIPEGKEGWKLTHCPDCGAECWRTHLAALAEVQGAKGICTMCGLKKGIQN